MNCNNQPKIIRVPRGNVFRITTILTEKVLVDGVMTDQAISIGTIANNGVKLKVKNGEDIPIGTSSSSQTPFYTRDGSTFVFTFPSTLAEGSYSIEVIGTRTTSGDAFRWQRSALFAICEYTDQAYMPTDTILEFVVDGTIVYGSNSGGGGGSATVGTLNTTNETAQTTNANESFGNNINLHRIAKTGSYEDLNNKPTIPNVPSWAMQSSKPSYTAQEVGALPSDTQIPVVNNTLIGLQIDGVAIDTFTLNQSQPKSINLSGLEKRLEIVISPELTNGDLIAQFGKYYVMQTLSETITINLPAVPSEQTPTIKGFVLYITIPNDGQGGIFFAASNDEDITESGLSDVEEGKTYEINAVWNGAVWAITANEFTAYSTT